MQRYAIFNAAKANRQHQKRSERVQGEGGPTKAADNRGGDPDGQSVDVPRFDPLDVDAPLAGKGPNAR